MENLVVKQVSSVQNMCHAAPQRLPKIKLVSTLKNRKGKKKERKEKPSIHPSEDSALDNPLHPYP
jgi:hypothetical protein